MPSALSSSSLRERPELSVRGFDWLMFAALLAVAAATVRTLMYTPIEATQGIAQKIFYIHVPAAVISLYISCIPSAIASLVYLWLKDERVDRLSESLAEVGMLFLTVVLASGPFWGKTQWGTWWQWDARLTSTLFLCFVLVAYLVMRDAIDQPEDRARLSAVLGALIGLLVPFIHLTVYLFPTIHPDPVVLAPEKPKVSSEMLTTLLMSTLAYLVLYAALLRKRYRWATQRDLQRQYEDQLS
ncbi:MAG: cytochrome c biogenesis protein CcsA [Phycisphaerae bacterium]|nr:cytochrome c biogenesis protein CcsA [Gemmatimonadaceae bacterium]